MGPKITSASITLRRNPIEIAKSSLAMNQNILQHTVIQRVKDIMDISP